MPVVKIRWSGVNSGEENQEIQVTRPPESWEIGDATAFLHELLRAASTPAVPLRHVESIRVRYVKGTARVVIEVVTNAGAVVTEPLAISPLAAAWLEKASFEMPGQPKTVR